MIYLLVDFFQKTHPLWEKLRVIKYISFRAAAAMIIAFLTSLIIGPYVINRLRNLGLTESILTINKAGSQDLSELHKDKKGTPTMGGIIIIISILVPVLLLCDLSNANVIILILMTLAFGALGFYDDYTKKTKSKIGISRKQKIYYQLLIGLTLGVFLYFKDMGITYYYKEITGNTYLSIPFFKNEYPNLGLFYIPFVMLVIAATSNAVNLTDGLDGLAIGTTIFSAIAYTIIAYLVTRADYSKYLIVPYISKGGEIVVFLSALIGAGLGFLWFNSHPAEVFMGDTGSLTIGGLLGTVAILLKMELLLMIIGGMFVIEALSVIIQISIYKKFKKRFFLMAPIHHHFEKKGLDESKIIIRFWIVSILLALFGLASLKLR